MGVSLHHAAVNETLQSRTKHLFPCVRVSGMECQVRNESDARLFHTFFRWGGCFTKKQKKKKEKKSQTTKSGVLDGKCVQLRQNAVG